MIHKRSSALVGMVSKNILQEGLNRFHGAPTSPLAQMALKPDNKPDYLQTNFERIVYINDTWLDIFEI